MTSSEEQGIEATQQYPYSVKIEQSSYGARISVHAYANTKIDAIHDAVFLYTDTRMRLRELNYKIAPEEAAVKKETVKPKNDL